MKIKHQGSKTKFRNIQNTSDIDPDFLQKPIFSFQHIHKDRNIKICEKDDKAAIIDKLEHLSQLTWNQIHSSHKHGCGCEKIIKSSITYSMPKIVTQDVNLIAFRCSGKKPMIGFREDNIFHILFIDDKYDVYQH